MWWAVPDRPSRPRPVVAPRGAPNHRLLRARGCRRARSVHRGAPDTLLGSAVGYAAGSYRPGCWLLAVRPTMQPVVFPDSAEMVINDFTRNGTDDLIEDSQSNQNARRANLAGSRTDGRSRGGTIEPVHNTGLRVADGQGIVVPGNFVRGGTTRWACRPPPGPQSAHR